MLEKLVFNNIKNYGKTLNITRALLVATFTFSTLFEVESVFTLLGLMMGEAFSRNVFIYLLYGILSWGIFELFIRFAINLTLNYAKIYVLPEKEIALVALMLAIPRNVLFGLFKLSYFLSPIIAFWGDILLEILVTLPFAVMFWKIIKKNYLSSANAPFVFKVAAIVFFGYYALSAAISLWGLV